MLRQVTHFLNLLSRAGHDAGTQILLPIMIIIITLNVILRYIFNSPLSWGEEANGLLLFMVLFLSLTYTWDRNRHIRMEIVYARMKGGMRRVADIVSGLTGITFFGLMGIQSIRDIPYMIKTHETGEELIFIPLWPFRIVMAAISFIFIVKLIIYTFRSRAEIEEEIKKEELEKIQS
jgi:TRAP-type C4-dicarboxylate transport system permease small subunit